MRVRAIIGKEWEEIVKNRSVFWSLVLLPGILTIVFLGVFFAMHLEYQRTGTVHINGSLPSYLAGYAPIDAIQTMMLNQFMVYFLMAPAALPIYIAAYSIIGEKQSRSLEPLLATPVRTWELLLGKAVAAVVPPVVAGWVSYLLFGIGVRFLASDIVWRQIVSPVWLLAIILLSPSFGLLSVLVGVIVSSRMNDPRAAQQWSALFFVPLVALGIGMMLGLIVMNVWTALAGVLAVLAIDAAMLYVAVHVFQREAILTRWK